MTAVYPDFIDKMEFLFEPHRYKVCKGGRGGVKSCSFARALLILGVDRKLRILCAREHQASIMESVHKLLSEQILLLGLERVYTVLEKSIVGKNGTEFIFAGLRHNIRNIKSLESVDIVWVEEADAVSADSWQTLIPTVRKPDSEIWISFNPRLEADETYKRFVLNPPPGAVVVHTDYRDNPWLPEVLRVEMEYMRENDPKAYTHVWLGECRSAIEGAIYGEEIKAATDEQRICAVSYDRTRPVDTFWDLGFGDKTAAVTSRAPAQTPTQFTSAVACGLGEINRRLEGLRYRLFQDEPSKDQSPDNPPDSPQQPIQPVLERAHWEMVRAIEQLQAIDSRL